MSKKKTAHCGGLVWVVKVRSFLNAFLIAEIIELEWLSQFGCFDELNHGL